MLRAWHVGFSILGLVLLSAGCGDDGGRTSTGNGVDGSGGRNGQSSGGSGPSVGGNEMEGSGGTADPNAGGGSGGTTGSDSGGSSGEMDTGGSGGTDTSSGGSSGTVDCSNLPVCEDFEGGTVGSAPDPSLWALRLNYGNEQNLASQVVIDDAESRSGSKSVKITASPGQTMGIINTSAFPVDSLHLRAWMKVQLIPGQEDHPIFIGIGQEENDEVRLRRFNGFVTANTTYGDGIAPNEATSGSGCPSCTPMPSDWFCVEMFVDRNAEDLTLAVNGQTIVSAEDWNSGTTTMPQFNQVRLGFLGANGSAGTVWFDDIAMGPAPIGCD